MAIPLRPSFVEIDLTALTQNFLLFSQSKLGQHFFCPMIKANAYGHGDVQIAQQLEKKGCPRFGVGLVEEGIRLRQKGAISSEILVFGFVGSEAVSELIHYNLTPVVSDFAQLNHLRAQAQQPLAIHLKINTGMNRLGFVPEELSQLVAQLHQSPNLKVVGLGTHLMSAEDMSLKDGVSRRQLELFQKNLSLFSAFKIPFVHVYNSSGAALVDQDPVLQRSHAYGLRIGLGLYGLLACESPLKSQLRPVMRLRSKIVAVQKVKKGQAVSYGATWVAPHDSVIGVVPMGYADGIPTQLSNQGHVLVGEKHCSIVGRVCMDYTLVHVSKIANPISADVEFFGPTMTASDVAQKASTISYDLLTRVSERVPRVFVHSGDRS